MSSVEMLEKKATGIRKDIVEMICKAKSGHPGKSHANPSCFVLCASSGPSVTRRSARYG